MLKDFPVDTGRKLNVHKTFKRRPGRLLNVLCTFSLRPGCTGFVNLTKLFLHTFSQFTMAPDLLWKGPHIYISSVLFVISMMFMNVFNSPYFFLNIIVIHVCFYYFILYFKLFYPIVDITLNHLKKRKKTLTLREKCLNTEFFWSVFSCIRIEYW